MSRKQLGEVLGRVNRLRDDQRAAAHNKLIDEVFEPNIGPDDFRAIEKNLIELRANPKLKKSEQRRLDDLIERAGYVIQYGIPRAARLSDE